MLFRKGHCDVADLDEDCVESFVVLQNDTRLFLFNGDDGCLDNEGGEPLEVSIINEFDTTHAGLLSRDEFMVLADLVTR